MNGTWKWMNERANKWITKCGFDFYINYLFPRVEWREWRRANSANFFYPFFCQCKNSILFLRVRVEDALLTISLGLAHCLFVVCVYYCVCSTTSLLFNHHRHSLMATVVGVVAMAVKVSDVFAVVEAHIVIVPVRIVVVAVGITTAGWKSDSASESCWDLLSFGNLTR